MIRILAVTDHGPLIILGVVETNLDRLRNGQPIHVDLGRMFAQSQGDSGDRPAHLEGRLGLAITYGTTHVGIIDELAAARIPIDDEHRDAARKLDDQLRREGLL
jgi:hypothetical protein